MEPTPDILLSPNAPLLEALDRLDKGSVKIVLIVDEGNRLLGTVTDGDIRRALLGGVRLDSPVDRIMNRRPVVGKTTDSTEHLMGKMRTKELLQIPIVDGAGRVVGLETLRNLIGMGERRNWVVLMAGGEGKRLRPLTQDCPKPLLPINGKPILEHILQGFVGFGFSRFFLSVNYKAEMIKDYFGDGSKWDSQISYLHEKDFLGTAGALSLLEDRPQDPIILMNGDLITDVNYPQLLEFHAQHGGAATMCVREYEVAIPYGVVRLQDHWVDSMEEKPLHRHFVNAGIYVLNPTALSAIHREERLDIPGLFDRLWARGDRVAAFPIRENWLDVGHLDDFHRAASQTRPNPVFN